MENLFQLGVDSDRFQYISSLLHSLGSSYMCLWLHSSPQNYLQYSYGYYHGDDLLEQQPSSSYGSRASRLFNEYQMQTIFITDQADLVPGLAFKRGNRSLILREFDLHQLASSDIQRQFYVTAVFMGCRSGEIELGFSIVPQNLELELRKIFYEDFQSMDLPLLHIPNSLQDPQQQSRPSSSSSRSVDSPEYPSFLFNLSTMREAPLIIKQQQQTTPNPFTNHGFPTPESVDAALTKALIASLTPPISPSTVSSLPPRSGQGSNFMSPLVRFNKRGELSAFKSCGSTRNRQAFKALSPGLRRQNMLNKVLSFYRGLNVRRLQQHQAFQNLGGGLSRPTSTQLHHVMSERKRREKINESFQALRSLLPSGTKQKDKATVLRITKEYMRSLRDQISELNRKNQLLESQLSLQGANVDKDDVDTISSDTSLPNINERVHIQLTPLTESSSVEERRMDLQVSVRGDGTLIIDLVMRLLDFLKGVREVRLGSMDSRTITVPSHEEQQYHHQQQQQHQQQQNSINRVTLRLTIEGNEWDQSAFLEAVRRVIDDLAH
ncbi:hypothetical protein V2J09_012361 [Rumex salicifolius]